MSEEQQNYEWTDSFESSGLPTGFMAGTAACWLDYLLLTGTSPQEWAEDALKQPREEKE